MRPKWLTFIDNRNIDLSCLNRRGIHLNRRGSSQNFLNHLRYWHSFRPGCRDQEFINFNLSFPKVKGFKMGLLNIVSLTKNIEEIRILLADQCLDILALNETRLDWSIHDDTIYIRGYDLIRSDRSRTGRGVCLYIKQSLQILKIQTVYFIQKLRLPLSNFIKYKAMDTLKKVNIFIQRFD